MPGLDKIEQALISILRTDARTSVVELSKKLRVSRATVQNRLSKLEQDGTILGYTVNLKAGTQENPIRAYMCINAEGKLENSIIKSLRGNPLITALHSTNGKWDLIAEIQTTTLESFNQVLSEVRLIDGVTATETSLLLETYKF